MHTCTTVYTDWIHNIIIYNFIYFILYTYYIGYVAHVQANCIHCSRGLLCGKYDYVQRMRCLLYTTLIGTYIYNIIYTCIQTHLSMYDRVVVPPTVSSLQLIIACMHIACMGGGGGGEELRVPFV